MSLTDLSATDLSRAIKERRFTVREVVEAHLQRIEAVNPRLNAIVTLDAEGARAAADRADDSLARGDAIGPIHGVPFTLKDMLGTAGMRTTLGLKMLEGYIPTEDSVISERLKRAGGILLGKTNLAMSIQTNSELFGRTSNPYDLTRGVGGSSGGSVSAVAARLVPFDVGTDLSGSIRMPCHFCGVFGVKPTPQRIPLTGMLWGPPGTPRPDRVLGVAGPITRTAEDLALLFGILAGPHRSDPDVPPVPVRRAEKPDPRRLRIAILPTIDGIRIAKSVSDSIVELGEKLSRAGARVEQRPLPFSFEDLLFAFRRLIAASLSTMGKALAPPGSPPAEMPLPSTLDFFHALAERDRFIMSFETFLSDYDAFVCAPAIVPAFPHTERGAPIVVDGTPTPSITVDHPALIATYTGAPAVVVPVRLDADGLPLSVQCIAKRYRDEELMALAATIADMVGPLPAPKI